jgi:hypothetical protein
LARGARPRQQKKRDRRKAEPMKCQTETATYDQIRMAALLPGVG